MAIQGEKLTCGDKKLKWVAILLLNIYVAIEIILKDSKKTTRKHSDIID